MAQTGRIRALASRLPASLFISRGLTAPAPFSRPETAGSRMRIAQIAPLFESVPPQLYGGTERIVYWLTEELVAMGHDVTLFASGDSQTSARLVPCCEKALRLGHAEEPLAHQVLALETAFGMASEFDVIHSHVDYLAFPYARQHPGVPVVATCTAGSICPS